MLDNCITQTCDLAWEGPSRFFIYTHMHNAAHYECTLQGQSLGTRLGTYTSELPSAHIFTGKWTHTDVFPCFTGMALVFLAVHFLWEHGKLQKYILKFKYGCCTWQLWYMCVLQMQTEDIKCYSEDWEKESEDIKAIHSVCFAGAE